MTACYHDPCDLGRHSGVFDEPRRILREAGVELVEFATTREYSDCCGMGGLLMVVDQEASNFIGADRVRQALDEGTSGTGRGFVLMPSSCPYGRVLPAQALRNYETMIEAVEAL